MNMAVQDNLGRYMVLLNISQIRMWRINFEETKFIDYFAKWEIITGKNSVFVANGMI